MARDQGPIHALIGAGGIAHERDRGGEYTLWQRRFWEHLICDEGDFGHHVDYIHYNPVKHGLVARSMDWRGSSIHRYIRLTRQTAQGVIGDYRRRHPEAIDFDASRKRQVTGKGFQPRYIRV